MRAGHAFQKKTGVFAANFDNCSRNGDEKMEVRGGNEKRPLLVKIWGMRPYNEPGLAIIWLGVIVGSKYDTLVDRGWEVPVNEDC